MNDPLGLGVTLFFCLILIGLMGLKVLPFSLRTRFDRATPALSTYLKDNIVASGPLGHSIAYRLPEDFYGKKLILLGEIHGYGAMSDVDYDLIVHLNKHARFTDYLAELGPIEAAYFNAYLADGDPAHLKAVFDGWRGVTRWANHDFYDKLGRLKAYNDALPPQGRISFTGIDQVQNFDRLHDWLALAEPRLEAADSKTLAQVYLTHVMATEAGNLIGGQKTRDEIIKTLNLMAQGLEREAIIFETYQWQVTTGELKDRPAYGLWHTDHVLKAPISKGFMPFAARVAASGLPAAASMATIVAWSDKGELLIANNEFKSLFKSQTLTGAETPLLENDGPLYYLNGLGDLRASFAASGLGDNGVVMFTLTGAASPFAGVTDFGQLHTLYRFGITYDAPQKPVTEVFDYIMLVRGSSPARAFSL
jgi:hypothetical protein